MLYTQHYDLVYHTFSRITIYPTRPLTVYPETPAYISVGEG